MGHSCDAYEFLEVSGDELVLVDFAIAFLPVKILAAANPEPCNDLLGWDFGSVIPMIHVVDNLVAGIRGNPASV
jgi:hypothetical protein